MTRLTVDTDLSDAELLAIWLGIGTAAGFDTERVQKSKAGPDPDPALEATRRDLQAKLFAWSAALRSRIPTLIGPARRVSDLPTLAVAFGLADYIRSAFRASLGVTRAGQNQELPAKLLEPLSQIDDLPTAHGYAALLFTEHLDHALREVPRWFVPGVVHQPTWGGLHEALNDAVNDFQEPETLVQLTGAAVRFTQHLKLLLAYKQRGIQSIRFQVAPDACRDCTRVYLVNGEPRGFVLKTILRNIDETGGYNRGPHGSWVALPILHPGCRCVPVAAVNA